MPHVDAGSAGRIALETYDENKDGILDAEELEKCPSLVAGLSRIDSNSDGQLSADEIKARVNVLLESGAAVSNGTTDVTLDGKPLAGATITYEPEGFMGDEIKTASGVTDDGGRAVVTGAHPKFPGINIGMYRVRISKMVNDEETLPARYNTESELGWEQASDIPERSGMIEFHLTSGG